MTSGETLLTFMAARAEPPSFAAARVDSERQRIIFGAGCNHSIMFSTILPRQYNGGGVEVYIHYAMTSAELIKAWPELPEHIKAAIKALVQTHSKQ